MTAARGDESHPLQLVTPRREVDRVPALLQRAEHLRRTSLGMHAVVAQAYRRRASELEFEAWLTEMRTGEAGAAA